MKTIYLAGNIAYTRKTKAFSWRYKLKKELKSNFKVIIPTKIKNARRGLTRDLNYIKNSDIILAKINKSPSWGTGIELQYAKSLKKQIILFTTDNIQIHGWLKCLADKLIKVKNYNDLVFYLNTLK